MYYINKLVGYLVDPVFDGVVLLIIGIILLLKDANHHCRPRPFTWTFLIASAIWFYFLSMPFVFDKLALGLEKDFPITFVEDYPTADAIIELGNGVGYSTNAPYSVSRTMINIKEGSDRAYFAAQLWKAGKAPIIIPTGIEISGGDDVFMMNLGVPKSAILVENSARNTEENIKFSKQLLETVLCGDPAASIVKPAEGRHNGASEERKSGDGETKVCERSEQGLEGPPSKELPAERVLRVLLVTSAFHMPRGLLMCQKYAPEWEVIPAATDYMALPYVNCERTWRSFVPNIAALYGNIGLIKEYVALFGYKYLRR